MKQKTRPYSEDSNMLLVMMHNEGDSLDLIIDILDRDEICVRQRLWKLFESGKAKRIHNKLMCANGLYARRMEGIKPKYRFGG